ncbi:MAG: EF-hand domain-containing protein [Candidatus Eremiobacteraeota bacterium]|nr:EF-hand domain-containing protein [Candidatus Eremiobacteraeota bacterium]MCW5865834.1 EF-hand domain-containing protein [Candidatus Eremiobacteraeota bacterium]
MKKTLTLMFVGMLAAASWAQPNGDGTLPGYEAKPGWVNGQDATGNPGSNPANARRQRQPWNQNGQNGKNGQGRRGKRMARFDKNGDGQLDESERAAARAEMLKRFDTNGDGQISEQERQAVRAQMMKRFDTNGDGQLSDQEKQAARAARGQRQGGRRHRQNGQFQNQTSPTPNGGTSGRGGPLG